MHNSSAVISFYTLVLSIPSRKSIYWILPSDQGSFMASSARTMRWRISTVQNRVMATFPIRKSYLYLGLVAWFLCGVSQSFQFDLVASTFSTHSDIGFASKSYAVVSHAKIDQHKTSTVRKENLKLYLCQGVTAPDLSSAPLLSVSSKLILYSSNLFTGFARSPPFLTT